MITEDEVRARTVPLILGVGGGDNTWAVVAGLAQRGIRPDLLSFADTGGEREQTYEGNERLRKVGDALGWPELTVVRKESPRVGDRSLEEECLRRETMPSRAFGLSSCAMRWKIEPQEKFLNHWPPARAAWAAGKKPIKILGYDGGEQRRASITEDDKLVYWYPLIEWGWDRARCVAEIRRMGWEPPGKSACFYCPSSTKQEVLALALDHPDLFWRAVAIERKALMSTRHDLRNIRGLGRHWSWESLVAMDEATRAQQIEAPVEACMVCDDGGGDDD